MKINTNCDITASESEIFLNIGKVVNVLSKIDGSTYIDSRFFYDIIVPATIHRKIIFFYNIRNQPVAFLTWCNLHRSTSRLFESNPTYKLHFSEWSEGGKEGDVWINSFYCQKSSLIGVCKNILFNRLIPYNSLMFHHLGHVKKLVINI